MIDEALFASVAHEVKTPLAVLRGYAELLVNRRDGDIQREAPQAILEAGRRLAPALDDLLLALEIHGGLESSEAVDLADLVPGTTRPLPVLGDARLLQRAVEILGCDSAPVSVTADQGTATVVAGEAPRTQLELYLARLIAKTHRGALLESPEGLAMTLPLA